MRRARRGLLAASALAMFALLAGCLDFDEQEVVVTYEGERDQLDAQIVYRGLHSGVNYSSNWLRRSSDNDEDDVEGTERELDQLTSGTPILALFHAAYAVDLDEMRRSSDPIRSGLANEITVDHGSVFRDAKGRLCGWQHLRIRDVHHSIELFDANFREELESPSSVQSHRISLGCMSTVSGVLWKDAIAKKRRWFEEVEGRLIWHVPASEGDAQTVARRIEKASTIEESIAPLVRIADSRHEVTSPAAEVVRSSENEDESDPICVLLHSIGATTERTARGVDIILWDRKREPQVLRTLAASVGRKHWDLAPYLEKRRIAVRNDVTDETLRRDFDERRAR